MWNREKSMALYCTLSQYTLYRSTASCLTHKALWLDCRVMLSCVCVCVMWKGTNSHIKAWTCPCFVLHNGEYMVVLVCGFMCSGVIPWRWTRLKSHCWKTTTNVWWDPLPLLQPVYPPSNYRCEELRDKQSRNNPITSNGHAHDGSIWGESVLDPSKPALITVVA